jgi:hypothetical protein
MSVTTDDRGGMSFTTDEIRSSVFKAEPWAQTLQPCGNPRIPDFYPDSIIELCDEVARLRALLAQGAA